MAYEVLLTAGAERDLEDIYDHIAESDSPAKADYVLTRLLEVAGRLSRSRRQAVFEPYRLIYRLAAQRGHGMAQLAAEGRVERVGRGGAAEERSRANNEVTTDAAIATDD